MGVLVFDFSRTKKKYHSTAGVGLDVIHVHNKSFMLKLKEEANISLFFF